MKRPKSKQGRNQRRRIPQSRIVPRARPKKKKRRQRYQRKKKLLLPPSLPSVPHLWQMHRRNLWSRQQTRLRKSLRKAAKWTTQEVENYSLAWPNLTRLWMMTVAKRSKPMAGLSSERNSRNPFNLSVPRSRKIKIRTRKRVQMLLSGELSLPKMKSENCSKTSSRLWTIKEAEHISSRLSRACNKLAEWLTRSAHKAR